MIDHPRGVGEKARTSLTAFAKEDRLPPVGVAHLFVKSQDSVERVQVANAPEEREG